MDPKLIKKRIAFNFSGVSMQYAVSESLFSSYDIDAGTRALLNSLRKNPSLDLSKVLDLGCGYGPIGLFLKKQDPTRDVELVDRDALAVEFAQHNAKENDLDVRCYPSIDYQNVKEKFSLIVTNFPAKIWKKGLEQFVYGASTHLEPHGTLALVIVNELLDDFKEVIDNEAISVSFEEKKGRHAIYHLQFSKEIPTPPEPYIRQEMHYVLSKEYCVQTAQSIPEFDTFSFATDALIILLRQLDPIDDLIVLEPGQGHAALAAIDILHPSATLLISRDALALETSAQNIGKYYDIPSLYHLPRLLKTMKGDLTIVNVVDKQSISLYTYNIKKLAGRVILYGKESLVNNVSRQKPLKEELIKGHVARLFEL